MLDNTITCHSGRAGESAPLTGQVVSWSVVRGLSYRFTIRIAQSG
jgi:hypothetical protein